MANVDVELGASVPKTLRGLVDSVERGKNRSERLPPSIYMVSSELRDLSPSSFDPVVVSIGPLHRGDERLKEFEGEKEAFMYKLLHHLGYPLEQTLEACVAKVHASIGRIRESYAEVNTHAYDDVELAKMMVLDACFILEFFERGHRFKPSLPKPNLRLLISLDLMLVENQIPFFVLQDIFDCTILKTRPTSSLTKSLFEALRHTLSPFKPTIPTYIVEMHVSHILSYLHNLYASVNAKISIMTSLLPAHSAQELDRSGMNFKPNLELSWQMDMKYEPSPFVCFSWPWGKPTLRMPILVIDDGTERIWRNFIAYECSFPHVPYECSFPHVHYFFTSYAYALDMLVNTHEDVAKLIESKVIVNLLGSNEEAAQLINTICKHSILSEFYYIQEWKQMDKFYNSYWPKHIARLKRTYFGNPWTAIALFAGIILFALTVVQTIFTIRGN